MNLSFRDILVVKTIDEEGGLTKASEKLFVSQSALSHQLKKIEKEVQNEVFTRVGKQLIITPSGSRIVESSALVFSELQKLYKDLEAINKGECGTLSISTECYTCYHWLPPIIMNFQKMHPQIEIRVVSEATRRPMDYLERAHLDVAIVSDVENSGQFSYRKLFSDEMLAVLSKDHPLADKQLLTPADFHQQTMVLYDVADDDLFFLREFIKPNSIELKQVMKFELTEAIVEMVAAGMGIAIMANWAASPYLEAKKLVTRPISKSPIERSWYAATLKNRHPALVKHFVDFLEQWPFG